MEVGVTTGLFPKTFVDDVDIVFVLPTEAYVNKQDHNSALKTLDGAKRPIGCLKLTLDF